MIILDTNVVSALMQQQPDPQVVAWLDNQPAESVWLNSITLFEGRYGLALLPDGQRKKLLQERFEELAIPTFYYTPAIHKASFALPNFMLRQITQ